MEVSSKDLTPFELEQWTDEANLGKGSFHLSWNTARAGRDLQVNGPLAYGTGFFIKQTGTALWEGHLNINVGNGKIKSYCYECNSLADLQNEIEAKENAIMERLRTVIIDEF